MEEKFTFEGQRAHEDVKFVLKQHPWVMSRSGFVSIIMLAVLIASYIFFGFSRVTSIALILFLVTAILYGIYVYFIYNNNLFILTDERLIIIQQKNLFTRLLSETELDKIQNLTVEVRGMMKTLLNFGNIKITTAGVDLEMSIKNIENPYKVQQQITKYINDRNSSGQFVPRKII